MLNKEELDEIRKHYQKICDYDDAVPGQIPSIDQKYYGRLLKHIDDLESKNSQLEKSNQELDELTNNCYG